MHKIHLNLQSSQNKKHVRPNSFSLVHVLDDMSTQGNYTDYILKLIYFTSLAGASALLGFSVSINRLKRKAATDPDPPAAIIHEKAVALAKKALFKGTIYSFCGFGLLALATRGFWTTSDSRNTTSSSTYIRDGQR